MPETRVMYLDDERKPASESDATLFEVWHEGHLVKETASKAEAEGEARRLREKDERTPPPFLGQ